MSAGNKTLIKKIIMELKKNEQYTFRLADHKIPFPKGVTKCDLQFKVKGIDYISKTIEDVKEHRDKLYCTFTNEDTANMPEGLISYTMTFAGEFIDETEFSGETYVETTMYMATTEHCGGDCPELEREVEELTSQIAELNSQIEEKDAEIVSKDAEIAVLVTEAEEAYDNGVADQKAKLTSTTISSNGTYTREDGFNEVNVHIPTEDVRILDLTTNLQQMMANSSNYKYSSFFMFRNGAELNISSSQDVVIIDYEGNCTRYIGQSVTHRCTSYFNMVYVFSNSKITGISDYYAQYGCVYFDDITRYDYLPKVDKLDMYFTPEDCKILGSLTIKGEIKFHTKDKPNINTIVYPNNLFLYFPTGTDLEDLRAQYPNVTIIEF